VVVEVEALAVGVVEVEVAVEEVVAAVAAEGGNEP